MGLRGIDLDECISLARQAGHIVRNKDVQNYWNGTGRQVALSSNEVRTAKAKPVDKLRSLEEYELLPDIEQHDNYWVPCDINNKPMIKWGNGCMRKMDAVALSGQKYLGINNRGLRRIVIDIDGDHDPNNLDWDVIDFGYGFRDLTQIFSAPREVPHRKSGGRPVCPSFHICFKTDRCIPVTHHPHLDIIGNTVNTLQYLKTKEWNGIAPATLTHDIWEKIISFIKERQQ